jgi:hypothetical protein
MGQATFDYACGPDYDCAAVQPVLRRHLREVAAVGLNLKVTRMGSVPVVCDPELDMRRYDGRIGGILSGAWNALRKKLFVTSATAAPMRSIAREAEESWPTRDWSNG